MADATPSDVRVEIDTRLEDPAIADVLDRVAREIDREYDADDITFADTQHRVDFEAALAALRIAEGRDRRAEEVQTGRSSRTYEASEIAQLRKRVRRADPGDAFGHSGTVVRDTDRHISTTGDP